MEGDTPTSLAPEIRAVSVHPSRSCKQVTKHQFQVQYIQNGTGDVCLYDGKYFSKELSLTRSFQCLVTLNCKKIMSPQWKYFHQKGENDFLLFFSSGRVNFLDKYINSYSTSLTLINTQTLLPTFNIQNYH